MTPFLERIEHDGALLGIILSGRFSEPGIHFVTTDDLSQQLAYMHHPAGKQIEPHVHLHAPRQIALTQEVLHIRKGRLRVDFYTAGEAYVTSRTLEAGDTILLVEGGHGFEVLEEIEMIEVKQGPYLGEQDKRRFRPSARSEP